MMERAGELLSVSLIVLAVALTFGAKPPEGRLLVSHGGASAYAPEHTRLAYELAVAQGANYLEPDLAVTLDGHLVCLRDETLNRTTDVARMFPDRGRNLVVDGRGGPHWLPADFTLAELRTLDFGGWFDPRYAGERVVTFDEVVAIARKGRVGLIFQVKSPAVGRALGVDMVSVVGRALLRHGLASGRPELPVILQTFDEPTARSLAAALPDVRRVLLIEHGRAAELLSDAGLDRIATYVHGIGPAKAIIDAYPDVVGRAQVRGLVVVPWTSRTIVSPLRQLTLR